MESRAEDIPEQHTEGAIEKNRSERRELFKKVASHLFDLTFFGNFKMLREAIKGEDYSGEKLNTVDRMVHALIAFTALLGYYFIAQSAYEQDIDKLKLAGLSTVTSWMLFIAQRGTKFMPIIKESLAQKGINDFDQLLDAVSQIMKDYTPDRLIEIAKMVEEK